MVVDVDAVGMQSLLLLRLMVVGRKRDPGVGIGRRVCRGGWFVCLWVLWGFSRGGGEEGIGGSGSGNGYECALRD